ncbi:hypothetical protein J2X85_002519 [Microbacterium trichothecenolyticum]|nr:hypothetical protein [Microbacterium trichothecenolyticum]
MTRERPHPSRVGACGQFAFRVDDGVELHCDAGVDVRPLAVLAEHLDVQPEMPVDVRVERAGATVLQLDDFDAADRLTDAAAVPATRVQLFLPQEDHAVSNAVLQCLELGGQFRMQQCRDAVRLRVIQCPVEEKVSLRTKQSLAALLAADRVVSTQPHPQGARRQLVRSQSSCLHDEPRHRRVAAAAVRLERGGAGGVDQVRIAYSLERVGDRVANSSGLSTPFPPLETSAHGDHGSGLFA